MEKEKAGGSLVAPDVPHEYNLPEGMKYELGKGLSPAAPVDAMPGTGPIGAPPGSGSGLPKALQGGKL